MKILVTGGSGTMGRALREFLPDALYLGRAELDVRDAVQVAAVLAREEPNVVIHAAAITDHQHPNTSEIIETNILGTMHVARTCKAYSIKLVYLSTHYVYPGLIGNYKETDRTYPIGTYAWSKLAGEGWAQTVPDSLIIRGSWYTEEKVCRWLKSGVIVDAWCNRETPEEAARKIMDLIRRDATGVYNIGGQRRTFVEIAMSVEYVRGQLPYPNRPAFRWRNELSEKPYPFPVDSSVNTDKYEALVG